MTATSSSATAQSGQQKATPSTSTKKVRPSRILPTDRITVPRQFDILRGYAALSGPSMKPVQNSEVAAVVKMTASTISIGNAFLVDSGLVERTDKGIVPSQEVMSYQRAYEWNADTAAHKLAPLLAKTWFAEAVIPRLNFRAMEVREAISCLAEEATASTEYEPNLLILLQYLNMAGVIAIEGNMVRAIRPHDQTPDPTPLNGSAKRADPITPPTKEQTSKEAPGGAIDFNISVHVAMTELASWSPARITAFFSGVAKVMAAKNGEATEMNKESDMA